MKRIIIQLTILLVALLSAPGAWATTYYIDYAGGADTNNGTSASTPWKHAPGMIRCSDNCETYETEHSSSSNTDGAGNSFIFKGGVTWPNAVMSWLWNFGAGTEGTPITFGVDQTWYIGASWSRPVFDAESSVIGHDNTGNATSMVRLYSPVASYFVVDNLEFKGLRQIDNGSVGTYMLQMQTSSFEVKNCYFHGWSRGGAATTEQVVTLYSPLTAVDLNSLIHNNVWDGSDTTADMAKAYKGSAGHFFNNYVQDIPNGLTSVFSTYVWGNTFVNIGAPRGIDCTAINGDGDYFSFDCTAHGNTTSSGHGNLIFYNNYVLNSAGGATIYHTVKDGSIDYNFNNVMIADQNQTIQIGADRLVTGIGSGIYVFNNTIQSPQGVSFTSINGPTKTGSATLPFMKVLNNHLIADYPTVNFGTQVTEGGETESNNVGMTNTDATAAGYVATGTYPFLPPTGGATNESGMDLQSLAAGIPSTTISNAATAALSGTSCGVKYDAINHRVLGPKISPNLRGLTWDIGAYQAPYSGALITPQNFKLTF